MTSVSDAFEQVKAEQRKAWAHFAQFESNTIPVAGQLVKRAKVHQGQRVLDIACGTGVAAITAALRGAAVTGLDLTPELLERARENARVCEVTVDWIEGDAERLPFPDATFDVVLSQFGHIFAPRPEVAASELLRVLRPGGTLAIATWPPEHFVGRTFGLMRYMPPPAFPLPSPALWGDANVVRERFGDEVEELRFYRGTMHFPALSPKHHRAFQESAVGPSIRIVEHLSKHNPEQLEAARREFEAISAQYFEDNIVAQDYLISIATKRRPA